MGGKDIVHIIDPKGEPHVLYECLQATSLLSGDARAALV